MSAAPNPSTAQAVTLIDELARGGVRRAVISPGSRSTALAVAAEGHPGIEVAVSIDERSAGFFALGTSRVTGSPALVISTSGTAAANHFPAVVEADAAGVPLIVITADRPPELRGVGANQTIDQMMLFGGKIRWFVEVGVAEDRPDANAYWRSVASQAVAESLGLGGSPGPVHVNVAFREPTVPSPDDGRSTAVPFANPLDGRQGSAPWTSPAWSHPGIDGASLGALPVSGKGIVVAGDAVATPTRLAAAAGELGWPVLATAQSGARLAGSISTYHHLLELPGFLDRLAPDFVIRMGRTGPSPRLERLYACGVPQIVVDPTGRWLDQARTADHLVAADPTDLLEALVERVEPAPEGWLESWIEVDGVVRSALDRALDADSTLTEPRVARDLAAVPWVTLAVASSGPIRDVDAHLATGGRVVGNRGASGIDGFVSMALGAASESAPLVALCGDVSMLHDGNGLLIDPLPPAVFVIVNNNGGGLFYELPQARLDASFERLFLTPHGRDFEQLAAFHDLGYARVEEPSQFPKAVLDAQRAGGVQLVEAPTDAKAGADLRRRLDAVAAIAWSG